MTFRELIEKLERCGFGDPPHLQGRSRFPDGLLNADQYCAYSIRLCADSTVDASQLVLASTRVQQDILLRRVRDMEREFALMAEALKDKIKLEFQ